MLREPTRGARESRPPTPMVVRLQGELDILSAASTAEHLDALTSGPSPDLVVDLARLTFLDCSGIGVLCRARRRARERGGRVVLVITDPHYLRILRAVGLGDTFEVVDSVPSEPGRAGYSVRHRPSQGTSAPPPRRG
ncbi:STAS domain-containing protein [Streptomyces sp. Pv4-95]|uniref:STAS domain-containing protein n=1 Tax=Streptomyces sp. Pv4-95 TaxID=3049543 RepID=UPI00389178EF